MGVTVRTGYNTMPKDHNTVINRRSMLQASAVGVATGAALTGAAVPAAGQENETEEESTDETTDEESTDETTDEESTDETTDEESTDETTDEESTEEESSGSTCDGAPDMDVTNIFTPASKITSEDPAVVEANFRPDPTIPEDCTIMVDLVFRFIDNGFQWGGGADWDQSAGNIAQGTFEVSPGEIRRISGQVNTAGAEAGDTVTVTADYELWFEGNREDSRQQTGIRSTIEVEEPNPPEGSGEEEGEQDSEVSGSFDATPGLGIGSAIAGIGGAAYVLKSKLTGDTE